MQTKKYYIDTNTGEIIHASNGVKAYNYFKNNYASNREKIALFRHIKIFKRGKTF